MSESSVFPESSVSGGAQPSPTAGRPDLTELVGYVTEFGSAAGEPADRVVEVVCRSCSGTTFWMECSEEDGVARRTCTSCHKLAYIGDSEELWAEADSGDAMCPCGTKVFRLAVGYCLDAQGEITWIIVGARCESCRHVGVYADWSIDFEPSTHLLSQN
jgi:hypothetical protein